jgi:hypothetical protein
VFDEHYLSELSSPGSPVAWTANALTTEVDISDREAMKEEALSKLEEVPMSKMRFRDSDKLLQILEDL